MTNVCHPQTLPITFQTKDTQMNTKAKTTPASKTAPKNPHIGSKFDLKEIMGTTLEQFLSQSNAEYLRDVFDLVGKKASTPEEVQDFVAKKVRELQTADSAEVDLSKLFSMFSAGQIAGFLNPLSTLYYGSFLVKGKVIKFLSADGLNESIFFEMEGKYFTASSSEYAFSMMMQSVRNKNIHQFLVAGGQTPRTPPPWSHPMGMPMNPVWYRGGRAFGEPQPFQPTDASPAPWLIHEIVDDKAFVI
jgi:hypothetical protein